MPPVKKKTTPKKAGPKSTDLDDDVQALALAASATCLSISHLKPGPYFNASWGAFPYACYGWDNISEQVDCPEKRKLFVEILGMNLNKSYLRHAVVKRGGWELEVLMAVPRWFFEATFLEKKLGDEWHATDVMVAACMNSVVQPVCEIHKNPDR